MCSNTFTLGYDCIGPIFNESGGSFGLMAAPCSGKAAFLCSMEGNIVLDLFPLTKP